MEPVRKAVWYIESHFAEPITLDDAAAVAGLSRFHLSRSFAHVTGRSVTAYLRARRLSEAAKALCDGGAGILDVALAYGYGSHEAFTRAFRDQFGVTPQAVRRKGDCSDLDLVEPFVMSDSKSSPLSPPAVAGEKPILLAGLREFRRFDERAGIPAQWQRFTPFIGSVPGESPGAAFGACFQPASGEEGFDYLTAVRTNSLDNLPEGLSGARLDARRYAKFPHEGHVSTIGATCAAIFNDWLPASGEKSSGQLFLLEYYGAGFDAMTGRGDIEVWLPLG
ncbi:MAG: AraC family transcriptional regulator [Oricola sp.]|jgi:AraC family transcriptional regulator|nr:AraC family transcriptional regulator [Oricola sp.]